VHIKSSVGVALPTNQLCFEKLTCVKSDRTRKRVRTSKPPVQNALTINKPLRTLAEGAVFVADPLAAPNRGVGGAELIRDYCRVIHDGANKRNILELIPTNLQNLI
jgi:hypothetical protein